MGPVIYPERLVHAGKSLSLKNNRGAERECSSQSGGQIPAGATLLDDGGVPIKAAGAGKGGPREEEPKDNLPMDGAGVVEKESSGGGLRDVVTPVIFRKDAGGFGKRAGLIWATCRTDLGDVPD